MTYSRKKDRWLSVLLVILMMAPLFVLAGYIYVGIHFILKFW